MMDFGPKQTAFIWLIILTDQHTAYKSKHLHHLWYGIQNANHLHQMNLQDNGKIMQEKNSHLAPLAPKHYLSLNSNQICTENGMITSGDLWTSMPNLGVEE
jgi:hypothetical protein